MLNAQFLANCRHGVNRFVKTAKEFPSEAFIIVGAVGVALAVTQTNYTGALPIEVLLTSILLTAVALFYAVKLEIDGRRESDSRVRHLFAGCITLAFGFILYKNQKLPVPLLPAVAATVAIIARGEVGIVLVTLLGFWFAFLTLMASVIDSSFAARALASYSMVVILIFILNRSLNKETEAKASVEKHSAELESALKQLTKLNSDLVTAVEAAKSANEAKTRFLSNMSHEIRTPLNAIVGLVHLARRDKSSGSLQERLSGIEASSKILVGLVNDVLDLAKIEAGELKIDQQPFRLSSLLNELRELTEVLVD